jgi:hypothetical protein
MFKSFLVAIAVLTTFDAVAWGGYFRSEVSRQFGIAAAEMGELDWSWEEA